MKKAESYTLRCTFQFEAAHLLPNLPPQHKCSRLHGHSFHGEIAVAGPLDPHLGWVMDFGDIHKSIQSFILENLDHRYLNEISGLENPTSENIAAWLWDKMQPHIPGLCEIVVGETCQTACHYQRKS
jgi:6-pyruvoyltetrahydropterin/6-carboxytetrahydropterin synthase